MEVQAAKPPARAFLIPYDPHVGDHAGRQQRPVASRGQSWEVEPLSEGARQQGQMVSPVAEVGYVPADPRLAEAGAVAVWASHQLP